MTAAWLALQYVIARPLLNAMTALSIAAGIAIVVATSALTTAARKSAQDTAGGYQLLIAAKGSPVQAVLSTLFFVEAPTGNIPFDLYESLRKDRGVAVAVPFSFGDNYRGNYIVATTSDYQTLIEISTGRAPRMQPGSRWPAAAFEVIAGAAAAKSAGLKLGDKFTAAHGFVELPEDLAQLHHERAYTVVGVLRQLNSPTDRAIFTTLDTAWLVHDGRHGALPLLRPAGAAEQEGHTPQKALEITALLVHGKSYGDVARLSAQLSRRGDVQAVFPGRVATQLLSYLQRGQVVVTAMAWLAAGIAVFAITVSLLAAAIERRRQIATLRAIGASRGVVFGVLAIEAGIITGIGAIAGLVLGRAVAHLVAWQVASQSGLQLVPAPLGLAEFSIALVAVALGLAAGAIPAYVACREDVSRNLAPMI